jgi:hypothetical protein
LNKIKTILIGSVLYLLAGILMGSACVDTIEYILKIIQVRKPVLTYIDTRLNGNVIIPGDTTILIGGDIGGKVWPKTYEEIRFYKYSFVSAPKTVNICSLYFDGVGTQFTIKAGQTVKDSRMSCQWQ